MMQRTTHLGGEHGGYKTKCVGGEVTKSIDFSLQDPGRVLLAEKMAATRSALLVMAVLVASVFATASAADLFGTLQSDQRFKVVVKALVDTQEVDALRDRSNGSVPFVFIAQTDAALQEGLGPDGLACITRPEHVKDHMVQILRFMEVGPLSRPVKTAADLSSVAVDGKLPTINGMPIFVEPATGSGVILSGDAEQEQFSATVLEVKQINANVTLVVVANGFLVPAQVDEQIAMACFLPAASSSSPAVPVAPSSKHAPSSKNAPSSKAAESAPSSSQSGRQGRPTERRSVAGEPVLRKQIEDLANSLAIMKEVFDAEQACKEHKEQERKEKEKRKQEAKEQLAREEEERLTRVHREERRCIKKEEGKRKEAEFREGLRKELRMEIRMHVGGACEELHQRLFESLSKSKGKNKLPVYSGSDDDEESADDSDVEALSKKTGGLEISNKRKRSVERVIDDSPPMVTPAKRPTKRGTLLPKRFALSCRHPPMRRSPDKKTTGGTVAKMKKIPATVENLGKLRYVKENLRVLGGMNVDELKQICRDEDVRFEGNNKKMDTILAITDKHAHVAYGTDKEEEETTEGSMTEIQDDPSDKELHQPSKHEDQEEEDN
ncbi:hypothetical protein CBR_g48153 [Chara braunii]|uniref:FAS1 domain-containing protein n=1 Tax=Chara braunii TaxID=69332 RepID=A0A388M2D3_CHABU|nr:hypothetical protein CBR_g48153 [Chara braunii]|eukprot:GBG88623.1 hypothetical protein CBR_g48153 [Chara braunii]